MNHYPLFGLGATKRTLCGQKVSASDATAALPVSCPCCRDRLRAKVAAEASAAIGSEGQDRRFHQANVRTFSNTL